MTHRFTRRKLGLSVAAQALLRASAAQSGGLPPPAGTPILTVCGRIGAFNSGRTAQFDRAALEALGTKSFTTKTPWYDMPVTFEGVPMERLMEAVGAEGETITANALNDYTTDIPVVDFARYGVLLALKRDGAYMSVRDKGPLFIVYPYDSDAELRTRRFYARSAWSVAEIVVK